MHFRRGIGIQALLLDVADDADDLALHSYQVEIDALAERILRGKCLSLKFLIDDHTTRTILVVL